MEKRKCPVCGMEQEEDFFCRQCGWDFTTDFLEGASVWNISKEERIRYEKRLEILKKIFKESQRWEQREKIIHAEAILDSEKNRSFDPKEHNWCDKRESITIPDGYQSICPGAFDHWSNLKEIKISDTIFEVGECAFKNCEELFQIVWSSNLKTIGKEAFCGCHKLRNLMLPEKLEIIERGAFQNNRNLRSIYLPNTLKKIGADAFFHCPIEKIEEEEGLKPKIAYQMKRKFPTAQWRTVKRNTEEKKMTNTVKNEKYEEKQKENKEVKYE